MFPGLAPEAAEVKRQKVYLSLLKAFACMADKEAAGRKQAGQRTYGPCSNCLFASAVVAEILKRHGVSFNVVAGYMHLERRDGTVASEVSMPHVWIETLDGNVTDITYTDPGREIVLLGSGIRFVEDAMKSKYSPVPVYTPLDDDGKGKQVQTLNNLKGVAKDLNGYITGAPPHMQHVRRMFDEIMTVAFSPGDRVTINPGSLVPGMEEAIAAAAASSAPSAPAALPPAA